MAETIEGRALRLFAAHYAYWNECDDCALRSETGMLCKPTDCAGSIVKYWMREAKEHGKRRA